MNEKGIPVLQRITGKTWVNNHARILEPVQGYHCKLLMMLKDIPVVAIKPGSIQMQITQENLNAVRILQILQGLKDQINNILDVVDRQVIHIQQQSQELTSLRDFLIPMLMNGKVTFK